MGFSPFTSKPSHPPAPTRVTPPPPPPPAASFSHTSSSSRPDLQPRRDRQHSHESFISASGLAPNLSSPAEPPRPSRRPSLGDLSSPRSPSYQAQTQSTGRRPLMKQTSLMSMVDVGTAGQMEVGMKRSGSSSSGAVGTSGSGPEALRKSSNEEGFGRSGSRVKFSEEVQVQYLGSQADGKAGGEGRDSTGTGAGSTNGIGFGSSSSSASPSSGGLRSFFTRKKTVRVPSPSFPSAVEPSSASSTASLPTGQSRRSVSRSKSSESLKRDRAGQPQRSGAASESGQGQNPMYYPYDGNANPTKPTNRARSYPSASPSPVRNQTAPPAPVQNRNSSASTSTTPSWRLPDESDAGLTIMGGDEGTGRRSSESSGSVVRRSGEQTRRASEEGSESSGRGLRVSGESVRSGRSSTTARSPSPSRSPLSQIAFAVAPAYPSPSSRGITPKHASTPAQSSPIMHVTREQIPTLFTPVIPTVTILTSAPLGEDTPQRPYRSRTSSRPSPSASPTSPAFSRFGSSSSPSLGSAAFSLPPISYADATDVRERAGQWDHTRLSAGTEARGPGSEEAWLGSSLISTSPLSLDDAVFGHAEDADENKTKQDDIGRMSFEMPPPRTPPTAHTSSPDPSYSPYRPIFDRSNVVRSAIYADDVDTSLVVKPEPAYPTARTAPRTNRRSSRRMSGQSYGGSTMISGGKRTSNGTRSQQARVSVRQSGGPPWTTSLPSMDSGSSIMSLASLGIVLPMEDLAEIAARDARARAELKEETAFVPMFNIIPATPVVNADEFEGADPKRQSWEIGMENVQIEAVPRKLEAALELKEEVLAKAAEDGSATPTIPAQCSVEGENASQQQLPTSALNSHKTTSSVSSAISTSGVSDASSCSFATMTSMTSLSTSSTASSFPDVEEALGAMLARLSAGGNGPHELMSFPDYMSGGEEGADGGDGGELDKSAHQGADAGQGWVGLGFDFGGCGEDVGTPKMGNVGGFGHGLGPVFGSASRQFSVTSPLVLPVERTPMVNHKVPFYGKAKAYTSAVAAAAKDEAASDATTADFTPDETPRQNGTATRSGLFESTQYQTGKFAGHFSPLTNSHARNDSVASTASSACESSLTSSSSMSSMSDMDDIENASIAVVNNKVNFANSRTVQFSPRTQTGNGRGHMESPGGEYSIGLAM